MMIVANDVDDSHISVSISKKQTIDIIQEGMKKNRMTNYLVFTLSR